MMRKLKNLIRNAVNLGTIDSGKYRRARSRWLGRKSQKVESFVPFGTFGNPPAGGQQIAFSKLGQEANTTVLDGDPINRIKKDTKPGEYGTGNPVTGAYTYYRADGAIEIFTGDMTLELFADGSLKITGMDDVELIDVLERWMETVRDAMVITGIGLQPFSPTTIVAMQAIIDDLQKLKN